MDKVLLLGAGGQLGQLVARVMSGRSALTACTHDDLDITDADAVRKKINEVAPTTIINTAAYTAVDLAESNQEQAFRVNRDAVKFLAEAAPDTTRIVHISTDFVFSKNRKTPYLPGDVPDPVSMYGKSKLAGEQALLAFHKKNAVILRSSWLYSARGKNFLTTMLRLMANMESVMVVNDQHGSPTSAYTLAEVVSRMALAKAAEGIFHWSDNGVTTWYDFAVEIQRQALELGILDRKIAIYPVATSEYKAVKATRPAYSALDSTSTEEILAVQTLPWRDQLHDVLLKYKEEHS